MCGIITEYLLFFNTDATISQQDWYENFKPKSYFFLPQCVAAPLLVLGLLQDLLELGGGQAGPPTYNHLTLKTKKNIITIFLQITNLQKSIIAKKYDKL